VRTNPYWAVSVALCGTLIAGRGAGQEAAHVDEITVFGQGSPIDDTHYQSPSSVLTPTDLVSINAPTTEDLVKYEPSLVIRRRYIGDPNGTMGMRGSNMFQTTRSMVFADGIPLHYLLQTQWNGSPRWALVGADEIGKIEVVYGPFSAEYSGNAMGGVVNIETQIPTERRFHAEASAFRQGYDEGGFSRGLPGARGFFSYGDRFGGLSVYTAFSHLANDSQPMDYLFSARGTPVGTETPVTGSRASTDEYGNPVLYYGNTGSQASTTDQLKTKIGYQFDNWLALATVAYEERNIDRGAPQNYLRDAAGQPVWNGTVVDDGVAFSVSHGDFTVDDQNRRSLLLGGRLQGTLAGPWWLEASVSDFKILEDRTRASAANPADPVYTPAGTVTAYDNTGWQTASLKVQNGALMGNDALSLVTGYAYEHYSLGVASYGSANYLAGEETTATSASGGETGIEAVYAQLGWQMSKAWDLSVGGRYESWSSADGFYYDYARANLQDHIDRAERRFSPKLSIGYRAGKPWQLRYSVGRAYRFPIVEELFQNERRTTGTSIANANLMPENGLDQNLMLQRDFEHGYARVSLFREVVADVIFNQTAIVDNRTITTFLPVDEVTTDGVELVLNRAVLADKLDLRFNTTYADATITRNSANPAIEGKVFPRMPKWRANLLATYHVSARWDIGGGVRYSSNSFGDLDNADVAHGVFGAMDGYTQVNVRSGFQVNDRTRLNIGVDNLTDQIAFVHHPWPGRTAFAEASVSF
jgi:iron complex outermembrane receptor protein